MEISQIKAAIAVEEIGAFSKAAESLFVSQSALSQQIAKLEAELGVLLFERSTRVVKVTSAGQAFLDYGRQIISLTEKAHRSIQEFVEINRGSIIIGVLPIMGYLGLASLLAGFKKTYPNIALTIIEGPGDALVQAVLHQEIDVAIFSAPPETKFLQEEFEVLPLLFDELVLITNIDHPLARKPIVDLAETADEPYLIFKKSNYGIHKTCVSACQAAGFTPKIIFECSQLENIISLVGEGVGVAMVMARAVRRFPRDNIKVIPIAPCISRTTVLGSLNTAGTSHATRAFRDFALEWVNRQPAFATVDR